METKRNSRLMLFGLVLVIGLSAYLRLSGITWGTNSGYGHYLSFHPDEFISIRGMSPISFLVGKLKAPDASSKARSIIISGQCPGCCTITCRKGSSMPSEIFDGQFKFILLSGRLMTVAFDLAALVFLFAIISELTKQRLPALLGALLYGVFPMQVIYSHFMRTYALAIFYACL